MLQKRARKPTVLQKEKTVNCLCHHIYVAEQQRDQGMGAFVFVFFYLNALAILFSTFMPVKHLELNCTEGKK